MQPLRLRIDRGGADTSGDEYVPLSLQFLIRLVDESGRVPQRPHNIAEELALGLGDDRGGRRSYELCDDCNRASLSVVVTDGKRYSFALFIGTDDQELPRLGGLGNPRSRHHHLADVRSQHHSFKNLEHKLSK